MHPDKIKRIPAKLCYSHIGGKLGSLLMEQFIVKGWLMRHMDEHSYYITEQGKQAFAAMGIDLSLIRPE